MACFDTLSKVKRQRCKYKIRQLNVRSKFTYIFSCCWIFEKVAPEDLPFITGMTLKPRLYDSKRPQYHAKEKGEGREERGGEKKTSGWHS